MGNGEFNLSALPNLAQISNINDFLITDLNHDGNLDAIGIENLYVSEIETPRNDAGYGLTLLGDGKGKFSVVSNSESGFKIEGDAKKIVSIKINGKEGFLIGMNNADMYHFEMK